MGVPLKNVQVSETPCSFASIKPLSFVIFSNLYASWSFVCLYSRYQPRTVTQKTWTTRCHQLMLSSWCQKITVTQQTYLARLWLLNGWGNWWWPLYLVPSVWLVLMASELHAPELASGLGTAAWADWKKRQTLVSNIKCTNIQLQCQFVHIMLIISKDMDFDIFSHQCQWKASMHSLTAVQLMAASFMCQVICCKLSYTNMCIMTLAKKTVYACLLFVFN